MSKAVASTKRFQYHLFKRLENAVSRFQETTRPKKKEEVSGVGRRESEQHLYIFEQTWKSIVGVPGETKLSNNFVDSKVAARLNNP